MREAKKAPAPAPKPPSRPEAAAAPSAATPAFAEAQASYAGQSFARAGSVGWLGGGPVSSGIALHREAEIAAARLAPFGVIVEDGLPLGPGQIHRTDFVESMAQEIFAVADEELAVLDRGSADCPFLAHWHAFFRAKPAVLIERTIQHFAKPQRADLEGLREALLNRVREAARQWVAMGAPGADSQALLPPGVTPEAGEGESLMRKAESAASPPAPPGSAAAVRSQLGTGQPLDSGLRTRMERGFGTGFGEVRVHTGPEAARVSSHYSARAFAVGSDIGFAPGRFRPGSLAGDALIAHELAHVIQQRGASHDAGTGRSPSLERDADQAAASLVTQSETASPKGKSGLRLQLCICGDCDEELELDWKMDGAIAYSVLATEMRKLDQERKDLLAQPGIDPARVKRLAEIDERTQKLAQGMQQLGVQKTASEIISGIIAGEDLRQVTISEMHGEDPAEVYWGEQREFEAKVGYLPRNVEVVIAWGCSFGGKEEYSLTHKEYRQGGGKLKLEGDFWTLYGMRAKIDQQAGGQTANPGFKLFCGVFVAGSKTVETEHITPWMKVEHRIPSDVTIQVPQVDQQGAASPGVAAPSAGGGGSAPSTTPSTPASGGATADSDLAKLIAGPENAPAKGADVIMEGARIHYRLSWLAPGQRGQSPRYAIFWRIHRLDSGGPVQVQAFGPGMLWGITGPLFGVGEYEIRADVLDWETNALGWGFGTTANVTAKRKLKVISASDVGTQALATYSAQGGPASYATFVADIDKQLASLKATLAAGSVTPKALESQISQLNDMKTRLIAQMGSTGALPFPSDGKFVEGKTYAAPLTAVMVHASHAGAVPMSIFLKVWHDGDWKCNLVDTTTADVIAVPGSGGTVPVAVANAIAALKTRNEYPKEGYLYYSLNSGGMNFNDHFTTSHWTKTFIEWFDKILFVVGTIVGAVLLLAPEPTGATKAVGLALLAVTILRSSYAIYSNLKLGRPLLDQRNVLELLSILSAFLGIRGSQIVNKALQAETLTARAISSFRIGRGMIIASFATDAGTFVYAANDAIQQMEAAAQTGGTDEEREANFNATLMRLAMQGVLLLGNARDIFHPMPTATGSRKSVAASLEGEGRIQLDPASRARLEVDLRRMGFQDETAHLSDGDLVRRFADTHLAAARLETGVTPAATGGTRGKAMYDAEPTRHLFGGDISAAISRPEFRDRPHVEAKLEKAKAQKGGDQVLTNMTVKAGGKDVKCSVQVNIVDDISAISSEHGTEGGFGRVAVIKQADGTWLAVITMDGRLGVKGAADPDIRNVAGHEVDEAAIIIKRSEADPATNIAEEHKARVFVEGGAPNAPRSAHDVASAHELRRIFRIMETLPARLEAAALELSNHGTPIPPDVLRMQQRVNAMLDTMGFRDPAGRDARIDALKAELGTKAMPPALEGYIRGQYARQVSAELRIAAVFGKGASEIRPDLVIHLENPDPVSPGDFGQMGLHGGHNQNALYAMVDSTKINVGGTEVPRYQVSFVKEIDLAGMKCRLHIQYERQPGTAGAGPARDLTGVGGSAATFEAARAAAPPPTGWTQANAPKTTVDNMDIFLREVNQAFGTWSSSSAATGMAGNEVVFGAVSGATAPALKSTNGVMIGGRAVRTGGSWTITRAWLELSNFGW